MSSYDGCTFCRQQALRVEELRLEISQLKHQLYGRPWTPPPELHLSAGETAVLQVLVATDGIVKNEAIFQATRAAPFSRGQQVSGKVTKVIVCHLRRKMERFGLSIETVWGVGYGLKADVRSRLLNWTAERAAA